MYDEICSLLVMEVNVSETGDPIEIVSAEKEVFCRVYSASEREKTYASTRGKKAEMVVELPDRIDYNEEQFVRWRGRIYEVLDAKWNDVSDSIKLVVSRWDYR